MEVQGWQIVHTALSYADVKTQADYQQLDPNFVGLIFSCFNETDKVYFEEDRCAMSIVLFQRSNLQVICFQSVTGDQG